MRFIIIVARILSNNANIIKRNIVTSVDNIVRNIIAGREIITDGRHSNQNIDIT